MVSILYFGDSILYLYWNRDEDHDQHACDVASCPIACQLCGRLCESTEHLHGLDENTVHLCRCAFLLF